MSTDTGPLVLKSTEPYTDPRFKSAVEQAVKATLDVAGRVVWDIINEEPPGWLIANGQAVTSIFPVLRKKLVDAGNPHGTSGGNPLLPDLRNRMAVGSGSTYALGDTGGASTVTLTAAQSGVPAHVHPFNYSGSGDQAWFDYVGGGSTHRTVLRDVQTDTSGVANPWRAAANTAQDASASHTNMPPYVGLVPLVRAY